VTEKTLKMTALMVRRQVLKVMAHGEEMLEVKTGFPESGILVKKNTS
jgi:hypothetical protein